MTREDSRVHPSVINLALFSRKDLPFIAGLKVRWHLAGCSECGNQVRLFRSAVEQVRHSARTEPLGGLELDWPRLEREMLGNIAVGLDAARCIEKVGRKRGFLRAAALIAGLGVLFVWGWFAHIPAEQNARLYSAIRSAFTRPPTLQAPELKATPGGIAVRTQGATLTLLHPPSAVVSLSGSSAVMARYVDDETGQITITKVYAQ
jgi:hypothetical protein